MSDISLSLVALWEKEQFLYNRLLSRKTLQCLFIKSVKFLSEKNFVSSALEKFPFRNLAKTRQIICISADEDEVLRYCESFIKPPTWVFSPPKTKENSENYMFNDLNNERLHRGLRYSAKRNERLFRTSKQNKHKIILPLAIFKDHMKRYLASSPTTSKRSFPPPRRTRDPQNLKGKCIWTNLSFEFLPLKQRIA